MQSDGPPAAQGLARGPSRSSALVKDPDSVTIASRMASTDPTSLLLPSMTASPSRASLTAGQPLIPTSNTAPTLAASRDGRRSRALPSSATWTSSSGDLAMFSDTDEIEDRTRFVLEYNRLAKKHGIRVMVVGDFGGGAKQRNSTPATMSERRSWFSRLLGRASLGHGDAQSKLVRSFSDLALHLVQNKREPAKTTLSLQTMVTLSGKSLLYLPAEFSPRAMLLPTCFRATAQYLVQHGVVTRGIFRISGSYRTVNALFDYYCHQDAEEEVTRTIRCPNLPLHVKAGVHDVASAFKRFLSVLPGGILGSLSLFDAFIAIHSQLRGEPEFNRTRQTKLRARLIALAIGTLKSQFRRELICAVFGMLSLIGRQAELTPHEDEIGRPLPTSDLMGYSALGTVFGPLLVGNLLDSYTMKVAHPPSGLLLFPLTPPKLKKERAQKIAMSGDGPPKVDKVLVANAITEMLITHWREVVRHLVSVDALASKGGIDGDFSSKHSALRYSASDGFSVRGPRDWDLQSLQEEPIDRQASPALGTPTPGSRSKAMRSSTTGGDVEDLSVKRSRPKSFRSKSSNRISVRHSLNPLSPTAEESLAEEDSPKDLDDALAHSVGFDTVVYNQSTPEAQRTRQSMAPSPDPFAAGERDTFDGGTPLKNPFKAPWTPRKSVATNTGENPGASGTQPSGWSVPWPSPGRHSLPEPDTSSPSRQSLHSRMLCQSAESDAGDEGEDATRIGKPSVRSPTAKSPENLSRKRGRKSHPPLSSGIVTARLRGLVQRSESSSEEGSRKPTPRPVEDDRVNSQPSRQQSRVAEGFDVPEERNPLGSDSHLQQQEESLSIATSPNKLALATPPQKQSIPQSPLTRFDDTAGRESFQRTPTELKSFHVPMTEPRSLPALTENVSPAQAISQAAEGQSSSTSHVLQDIRRSSRKLSRQTPSLNETEIPDDSPTQRRGSTTAIPPGRASSKPRAGSLASVASTVAEIAQRTRSATLMNITTPVKQSPAPSTAVGKHTARKSTSKPGGVRAMAAMWEGGSQDQPFSTSPARPKRRLTGTKPGDIVSPYRSNTTIPKSTPPTPFADDRGVNRSPAKTPRPPGSNEAALSTRKLRGEASNGATLKEVSEQAAKLVAEKPEFMDVQLKQPTEATKQQPAEPVMQFDEDKTLDRPPSLGTIVPHQEEPPVDKHLNLSRPPSAASIGLGTPGRLLNTGEGPEGVPGPTPSPSPGGGNCLLHAQIRNLQKQLSSRSEEVGSLRRQLEAMENMDIGTLSEQLRDAKRECTMWKARAEAAEKRIAVFERFTSRLRGIREANAKEETETGGEEAGDALGKRSVSVGHESTATVNTAGTKDPEAVAARIRHSFKALDGTRSSSIASTASGDGGASAWWNKSRDKGKHGGLGAFLRRAESPLDQEEEARTADTVMQTWAAVEELLAYDDLMKGAEAHL